MGQLLVHALFAATASLTTVVALADGQSDQQLKLEVITCIVRYHGYAKGSEYNPAMPQVGFRQYLSNDLGGSPGVSKGLQLSKTGDTVRVENWSHVETAIPLSFKVDTGNNGVSPSHTWGDLHFEVTDTKYNRSLASADFLLENLIQSGNGSFIAQITVALPDHLIEAQKADGGDTRPLFTQVKYQCN